MSSLSDAFFGPRTPAAPPPPPATPSPATPSATPSGTDDAELARQREQARNREIAAQTRRSGIVAGRTIALEKRQEEYEAKKASKTLGVAA